MIHTVNAQISKFFETLNSNDLIIIRKFYVVMFLDKLSRGRGKYS